MGRISPRTGKPIVCAKDAVTPRSVASAKSSSFFFRSARLACQNRNANSNSSKTRKYRADFAYPVLNLLIEVEGGIQGKGGHSSAAGITRDVEKSNAAMLNGWRLLRCTSEHVSNGQCITWIEQALEERNGA
jgi:very-short-patch-repair endonuclease